MHQGTRLVEVLNLDPELRLNTCDNTLKSSAFWPCLKPVTTTVTHAQRKHGRCTLRPVISPKY